ncbi:hypothetical protein PVAP13_3NG079766, partial [Panicum virgatum]
TNSEHQITNYPAPGPRCAGLSHPQPPRGGAPGGLYKPPRTARIPPPPHRTRPGGLLFSSVRSPTRRPHRSSLRFPTSAFPARARARHLALPSFHVAPARAYI